MATPRTRMGLQQRAQQQMLLAPRMLQAIEVLQLPSAELAAYLRDAFESNVALVLDEAPQRPPRDEGPAPRPDPEAARRHEEWLRNQPAPERTVQELVEEQLSLVDGDPELVAWTRFLATSLDDDGLLTTSDERLLELARGEGLPGDGGLLGSAIALLQSLEPRGIGGRDLVEVLLLQLDPGDPDYPALCRLVEEFLRAVAHNKLPAVARDLGVGLEELARLLDRLRELDPCPGRSVAEVADRPLVPDVVVLPGEGSYEVRVERRGLPAVGLDEEVRRIAADRGSPADLRRYLRDKIDQARWIVDAVEQRRSTLQRVAVATFDRQRGFLERGPGNLVPLRMNGLADELGLHVSTVSRAVAGKTVQTPWGVFPLRYFFQSAAPGEEAARDDVRDLVREVVEGEDPAQPLSDEAIVERMRERGHVLARRTVAKYRKELGIPTSYRRRRYAG